MPNGYKIVYVTDETHELIRQQALLAGVSMKEWVRRLADSAEDSQDRPRTEEARTLVPSPVAEIRRLRRALAVEISESCDWAQDFERERIARARGFASWAEVEKEAGRDDRP